MPKGVMWRHADLFGALGEAVYVLLGEPVPDDPADVGAAVARFAEINRTPVHLPASPLMHVGRHFDPDEMWRTVERERVTQTAIVGDAFCKPMVRALDEAVARGEPYDLSSLLLVISSGGRWSAPVKEALMAHQPVLCLDSLGSSEGVGFANNMTAPGQDAETARFTIGARTKVLTEEGDEVEPGSGALGMLALGGNIPAGYYKDPVKSAATFREVNGVRYSIPGDFATVEADGSITLLGRGSVCINSGGEKIYPEEVEEAVKALPGVHDCLVVGVPDERFGEAVTAVVAPDDGTSVDPGLVLEGSSHLARFKRPRHVVVVDAVRRGPNGKADYAWAKETALAAVASDS
jgi:fatty-acyl-CoA synthase